MIHGFPCQPVEWSLKGHDKKRSSSERASPMRQCSQCFFCHAPLPACPSCGYVYPVESRMVEQVEGELVELDHTKILKRMEQGRSETLEDLIALGTKRGMKNPRGWAMHVHRAREAKRNG